MPTDDELKDGRKEALQRILDDQNDLKVVVAGPGTGKSFTFSKVLEQRERPCLALTFLNGLAQGLAEDLGDLADSNTFHGFSRHLLHRQRVDGVSGDVEYYPPLTRLIVDDIHLRQGVQLSKQDLGGLFRNLDDREPLRDRALESGSYYDAVSHDDSVYRVLRHLQANPDRVPRFNQIVVDEYQDFCPLEVAFIAELAAHSPVLIAGDDDQAIYAFRNATPDAIRDKAQRGEYQRFELPYCTRCTGVVVAATHTVVARAQEAGLLQGRLDKPYVCFLPEKREESDRYPHIVHARCSVQSGPAPYLGRYITQQIGEITDEEIAESHEKRYPTVLVIAPQPFQRAVEQYLKDHFAQVTCKASADPDPDPLDAYALLLADPASRLGWRILLFCLQPDGANDWVKAALDEDRELGELVPDEFRDHHLEVARLLAAYRQDEELLREDDLMSLAAALGVGVAGLADRIDPPEEQPEEIDPAEPTILITSLMGSKGLQAGHVFVVGLNEGHFPTDNDNPTDEEVCQLLVALTRTRKKCTVMSMVRYAGLPLSQSVFLDWLGPHVERVIVNRDYW